jgi:hypothetical protein
VTKANGSITHKLTETRGGKMLSSNLEFPIDTIAEDVYSPIVFHEEKLNSKEQNIHDKALMRAKKYLSAEAEMLESIIEVDLNGIYKKFGCTHLTPYCVKYLSLSEDWLACLYEWHERVTRCQS